MSTLAFTVSAASLSMLAVLWLMVLDRPKIVRSRRRRQSAPPDPVPARVRTTRAVAYRPPSMARRIRSLVSLGVLGAVLGAMLAVVLGLLLGGGILLLRSLLK